MTSSDPQYLRKPVREMLNEVHSRPPAGDVHWRSREHDWLRKLHAHLVTHRKEAWERPLLIRDHHFVNPLELNGGRYF